MALHLHLDGGGGQDLVARDHLVAHELRPRLGGVLDDREQVLVVDELLAVGELLDLAGDVLDRLRLQVHAELLEARLDRVLPRVLAEDEHRLGQARRSPGS